MCLGIPGQVRRIVDRERKLAVVDVSGVERRIDLTCVVDEDEGVDGLVGKWVLMHVGFAMGVIDEDEAARTLELMEQLGDLQDELAAMRESAQR